MQPSKSEERSVSVTGTEAQSGTAAKEARAVDLDRNAQITGMKRFGSAVQEAVQTDGINSSSQTVAERQRKQTAMQPKKPVIEVRNLHFSYGKNRVFDGASLKISEGKITTILGANGCGKSTLFSIITKNLYPRRGDVFIRGRNIKNLTLREFAQQVAIVHQYNTANDDITVERLVSFGRTPYQSMLKGSSDKDDAIIERAMEVTGVSAYRGREVSRLSGGQRQRVWIAMALAQDTKILLLDEPTTYLDIRYQIEILDLVRRLNREFGLTIVMVLHDINQSIVYSDELVGLKDGKVLVKGKPEDVITADSVEELYGIRLKVTTVDGQKVVLTA